MTQYQKLKNEVKCLYYKFEYSDICADRILNAHLKLPLIDLDILRNAVIENIFTAMPQLLKLLPYYDDEKMTKLKKITNDFKERFETIIVIGMGGAILNSKCLSDFISSESSFEMIFMHKMCKIQLKKIKESINIEKTGFLFISNSGDTIETFALAEFWYENLKQSGYNDFSDRFIYVYGLKSKSLLQILHEQTGGIFLEYDSGMGGRFSTFTTPNILIGMLSDSNIEDFFAGGNSILESFLSGSEDTVRAIISGAVMTSYGLPSENFSMSIINSSYDSRFDGMIHWYSTALAETLCKEGINLVISSIDLPIDQHGLMQSILENKTRQQFNIFSVQDKTDSKINKVVSMLENEVCFQCHNHQIPLRRIILENDKIINLGAIMMHMILEVISTAVLIGVEPFTQPKIDKMKRNLAINYREQFVP